MEMKITHIRRIETKEQKIVIGKVHYKSKTYNVTYNTASGNVVICEWYNLSKDEIEKITKFVLNEVTIVASK